MNSIKRRSRVT